MRLCFRLIPVEKLPADWHNSWEMLTDGWFWLKIDGLELFRYSETQMNRWENEKNIRKYSDFPVCRLWEGILDILGYVISSMPIDIANYVDYSTNRRCFAQEILKQIDVYPEIFSIAFDWWYRRKLVAIHPIWPDIHFFAIKDKIILCWNHAEEHDPQVNVADFSRSKSGEVQISKSDFIEAIQDFDSRLMAAMTKRIATLPNRETLRKEHEERRTWLQNQLNHPIESDWNAVREALSELKMKVG